MDIRYFDTKIYTNRIVAIKFYDDDDDSWEYYANKKVRNEEDIFEGTLENLPDTGFSHHGIPNFHTSDYENSQQHYLILDKIQSIKEKHDYKSGKITSSTLRVTLHNYVDTHTKLTDTSIVGLLVGRQIQIYLGVVNEEQIIFDGIITKIDSDSNKLKIQGEPSVALKLEDVDLPKRAQEVFGENQIPSFSGWNFISKDTDPIYPMALGKVPKAKVLKYRFPQGASGVYSLGMIHDWLPLEGNYMTCPIPNRDIYYGVGVNRSPDNFTGQSRNFDHSGYNQRYETYGDGSPPFCYLYLKDEDDWTCWFVDGHAPLDTPNMEFESGAGSTALNAQTVYRKFDITATASYALPDLYDATELSASHIFTIGFVYPTNAMVMERTGCNWLKIMDLLDHQVLDSNYTAPQFYGGLGYPYQNLDAIWHNAGLVRRWQDVDEFEMPESEFDFGNSFNLPAAFTGMYAENAYDFPNVYPYPFYFQAIDENDGRSMVITFNKAKPLLELKANIINSQHRHFSNSYGPNAINAGAGNADYLNNVPDTNTLGTEIFAVVYDANFMRELRRKTQFIGYPIGTELSTPNTQGAWGRNWQYLAKVEEDGTPVQAVMGESTFAGYVFNGQPMTHIFHWQDYDLLWEFAQMDNIVEKWKAGELIESYFTYGHIRNNAWEEGDGYAAGINHDSIVRHDYWGSGVALRNNCYDASGSALDFNYVGENWQTTSEYNSQQQGVVEVWNSSATNDSVAENALQVYDTPYMVNNVIHHSQRRVSDKVMLYERGDTQIPIWSATGNTQGYLTWYINNMCCTYQHLIESLEEEEIYASLKGRKYDHLEINIGQFVPPGFTNYSIPVGDNQFLDRAGYKTQVGAICGLLSDELGIDLGSFVIKKPARDDDAYVPPVEDSVNLQNGGLFMEMDSIGAHCNLSYSPSKQQSAKKILQTIADENLYMDKYGKICWNGIKADWIEHLVETPHPIHPDFIKSHQFTRTRVSDVVTAVRDLAQYDNGQKAYVEQGDTIEAEDIIDGYDPEYFGADYKNLKVRERRASYMPLESEMKEYLFQWCNQHNIVTLDLPLTKTPYTDIGAIIYLPLLSQELAFGEDYSNTQIRNGQVIFPFWRVFDVKYSNDKVTIKALQLHCLVEGDDATNQFNIAEAVVTEYDINVPRGEPVNWDVFYWVPDTSVNYIEFGSFLSNVHTTSTDFVWPPPYEGEWVAGDGNVANYVPLIHPDDENWNYSHNSICENFVLPLVPNVKYRLTMTLTDVEFYNEDDYPDVAIGNKAGFIIPITHCTINGEHITSSNWAENPLQMEVIRDDYEDGTVTLPVSRTVDFIPDDHHMWVSGPEDTVGADLHLYKQYGCKAATIQITIHRLVLPWDL